MECWLHHSGIVHGNSTNQIRSGGDVIMIDLKSYAYFLHCIG